MNEATRVDCRPAIVEQRVELVAELVGTTCGALGRFICMLLLVARAARAVRPRTESRQSLTRGDPRTDTFLQGAPSSST
jgi:hypothetical protein